MAKRDSPRKRAARECAQRLAEKRVSGNALLELKKQVSAKHGLDEVLKNSEVAEELRRLGEDPADLRIRATRSLSGVSIIAVMARPWPCPHGKCAYCPGGVDNNSPQAYTGKEPAALRATQNDFDPYRQVSARVAQLEAIGHEASKCELIVMGGTFNCQPRAYQTNFVKRAFDAFNGRKAGSLEGAFASNEKAKHRVVGVTFETRPDWAGREKVERLVGLGATRVELGVQTLDDRIYKRVNRGHTVRDVVDATRNCKEAFLKVGYHWMPGLLVRPDEDVKMFSRLFSDPRFQPDMIKSYPTLVFPGTGLYRMWKRGEFEPYDDETAAKTIAKMKALVPPYVRIMRVDRDVPAQLIAAGVKKSNLRQLARAEMERRGLKCRCIRCRETGLKGKEAGTLGKAKLNRLDYEASEGDEVFLSFDDAKNDSLVGFLRLRRNADGKAGIRELRVFGEQVPVGEEPGRGAQHRGFGRRLLAEAEDIAEREWEAKRLFVLPGAGVKPYYRRLGYADDGMYLAKKL